MSARAQMIDRIIGITFMLVASVAIIAGFVLIYRQQDSLRQARRDGDAQLCTAFAHLRAGEQGIIRFSTKPADLTNLAPERVPIVMALNAQRAKFRADALSELAKHAAPKVCG